MLLCIIIELIGYVGMRVASARVPYLSFGDYMKIRRNLLGEARADDLPRYRPVANLNYMPTPGYVYAGKVQHNDAGYRGIEVPLQKSDKLRILFLGGSTTYGSGVGDADSTYPAQVGQILKRMRLEGLHNREVEIINGGLESATSAEELAYYHYKFRYYQPDIVVLHTAGNDALFNATDENYQPDYSHHRNVDFNLPELPAAGKLAMRSYFISFVSISLYYQQVAGTDHPLVHHQFPVPNYAKWFDRAAIDTAYISPDAFYNNIDLLLYEIGKDGATAMVLPFVINEQRKFSVEHPEYVRRTYELNGYLKQLTAQHGAIWVPYEFGTITNETSWQDDCHLDAKGEYNKATLVGNTIREFIITKPPVQLDTTTF